MTDKPRQLITESDDGPTRLTLEVEVRELRQRIARREHALTELNRRIVELERGGQGVADLTSLTVRNHELERQVYELERQVSHLTAELNRLRNTKLFRWAAPARRIYRFLKEPTGG